MKGAIDLPRLARLACKMPQPKSSVAISTAREAEWPRDACTTGSDWLCGGSHPVRALLTLGKRLPYRTAGQDRGLSHLTDNAIAYDQLSVVMSGNGPAGGSC